MTYLPRVDHALPADDLAPVRAMSPTPEYPVSGDQTRTAYGTIGCRRHGQAVNIWHGPRVNRRDIRDVRIGDEITTWQGTGTVTRCGSVAGWYVVAGREIRWEAHEIERIQRNAVAS